MASIHFGEEKRYAGQRAAVAFDRQRKCKRTVILKREHKGGSVLVFFQEMDGPL